MIAENFLSQSIGINIANATFVVTIDVMLLIN